MMETSRPRGGVARQMRTNGIASATRTPQSRNKHWIANHIGGENGATTSSRSDGERSERGGHRGGRGNNGVRHSRHKSVVFNRGSSKRDDNSGTDGESEEDGGPVMDEPELETAEERERNYQELVKAREVERKRAIAEGKMDDPTKAKRLDEAITMVGTCMDMCPRFERYRRERENNLAEWETIPGTRRVDHRRAVKAYERAAGDKIIPSDLRPPPVLKITLNYLFRVLLPSHGFSETHTFIRDRSRAVRNDFTMQHETGPLAIECHDRCARYHIMALHFLREKTGFSIALEEQQLMNTLQSLKEFYEDQRGRYQSPTELEMRVYHRLIHIRDQRERHDDIPPDILNHPVFKLTTQFRRTVQAKSAPISKTSALVVDTQGMEIFGQLATVLREQGNVVMIYLVACILERLFGKDTIEDIESIRGDISIPDIIDGVSDNSALTRAFGATTEVESREARVDEFVQAAPTPALPATSTWSSSPFKAESSVPSSVFGSAVTTTIQPSASAFSALKPAPNPFTSSPVFGKSSFSNATSSPSISPFGQVSPFSSSPRTTGPIFGSSSMSPSGPMLSSSASAPTTNPLSFPAASPFGTASSSSSFGVVKSGSVFGQSTTPDFFSPKTATAPKTSTIAPTDSFLGASTTPLNPQAPVFAAPRALPGPTLTLPTPFATPTNVPERSDRALDAPSTPRPVLSVSTTLSGGVDFANQIKDVHSESVRQPSISGRKLFGDVGLSSLVPDEPRTPLSRPPTPKRVQPISLPPTPSSSAEAISKPNKALLAFPISTQVPTASSSGTLSPLWPSPTKSPIKAAPSGLGFPLPSSPSLSEIPKSRRIFPDSSAKAEINGLPSPDKGKGKETEEEAEKRAVAFERAGGLVKKSFRRWMRRTTDRGLQEELYHRSDAYKQKAQRQRTSTPVSDKKLGDSSKSSRNSLETKRRIRRRALSRYETYETDEVLVQRLKENHEEHERRWAPGSFLKTVRSYVADHCDVSPSKWEMWLSTNPEADGTAIWVQQKFDVPASGRWLTENAFAIPYLPNDTPTPSSPALIIFECTPIADVEDELERKYRVLDDCARLRNVMDGLPSNRRYETILVFIIWSEAHQGDTYRDLFDMTEKLVRDGVLSTYQSFCITSDTKDMDQKFSELLKWLSIDTEGKLFRPYTLRGLVERFLEPWKQLAREWLGRCTINGQFDWNIYGQTLQNITALLRILSEHVLETLEKTSQSVEIPSVGEMNDSDSAYQAVLSWLEDEAWSDVTGSVLLAVRACQKQRAMFPTSTMIDHLGDILVAVLELQLLPRNRPEFTISNADLEFTVAHFQDTIRLQATQFEKVLDSQSRHKPKRRSPDDEAQNISSSVSGKRMKLSSPTPSRTADDILTKNSPKNSPKVNGRDASSPLTTSTTVTADDSPPVTVAMLRALTRDVRRKYGNGR